MMNCWKKYQPVSVFFGITVLFAAAAVYDIAQAGAYIDSAHGKSIIRTVTNGYAKGNCYHCHEQHASVNNAEPVPVGGPDIYLGFASEENLCFGCHSTSTPGPVGSAVDLIETDMVKLYGHGTGTLNNIASLANVHKANETEIAAAANTPHVECTDCHNPHVAQPEVARRTIGLNTIVTPSPLEGVDGVDFSTYPSWSLSPTQNDPTIWNPPDYNGGTPTTFNTATMEYQICFKCHSSSNLYTEDFDSNPGGSLEWTDVALEFNPVNNSLHPITTGLTAATNSSPLDLNQLLAPWNNPGTQTMYCSDCHASRNTATPYGPHGSAVKWLLVGTNQNWPFRSSSNNGSSVATDWAYISGTVGAVESQTFCRNCHPDPSDGINTNNVHFRPDHESANATDPTGRCVYCHIRVPHGGKVSRLISTLNVPNRYRPVGTTGGDAPHLTSFTKSANFQTYDTLNCEAGCGTGTHNSAATESW